ncbi:hypothetical protein HOLleu_26645 [Holothuria leucospilota]|uniref:Uncharacterized protein n=1 Tax=Holothuria leucospilota TaxID=206669 RepID=A0A9Q1BPH3_HOLLE|nr:hypothetical protein HOLleu_26645 [Holothuria leucospilota]
MAGSFEPSDVQFEFKHDPNYRVGVETGATRRGRAPKVLNKDSSFSEFAGNTFSLRLDLTGHPVTVQVIDLTCDKPNASLNTGTIQTEKVSSDKSLTLKIALKGKHVGQHTCRLVVSNDIGTVIYEFDLQVLEKKHQCILL